MKDMIKKNKTKLIIAFIILALGFLFYKYFSKYFYIFKDIEEMRTIILSYGTYSSLIFIFIQIIQIVIFFIPGEVVQVAGGYIFGPLKGILFSIVGILIGSTITFLISRKLGKPFVEKICDENNTWLIRKIEKSKNNIGEKKNLNKLIFILYLIPGIPKDLLGYICGISSISLKDFLILSTVGRLPALIFSIIFGHKISKENIPILITLTVILVVVFIIAYFVSKKYINPMKEAHKNKEHKKNTKIKKA